MPRKAKRKYSSRKASSTVKSGTSDVCADRARMLVVAKRRAELRQSPAAETLRLHSGELVWAKQSGYSWWPALITYEPNNSCSILPSASQVHCMYFSDRCERGYVNLKNVRPWNFTICSPLPNAVEPYVSKTSKAFQTALDLVKEVVDLSPVERLRRFAPKFAPERSMLVATEEVLEEQEEEEQQQEQPAKQSKQRKRKKKKESTLKRPKSAFFLFLQDKRPALKKESPGLAPAEVAKQLGLVWNAMSDQDKEKYFVESAAENAKYTMEKQRLQEEETRHAADTLLSNLEAVISVSIPTLPVLSAPITPFEVPTTSSSEALPACDTTNTATQLSISEAIITSSSSSLSSSEEHGEYEGVNTPVRSTHPRSTRRSSEAHVPSPTTPSLSLHATPSSSVSEVPATPVVKRGKQSSAARMSAAVQQLTQAAKDQLTGPGLFALERMLEMEKQGETIEAPVKVLALRLSDEWNGLTKQKRTRYSTRASKLGAQAESAEAEDHDMSQDKFNSSTKGDRGSHRSSDTCGLCFTGGDIVCCEGGCHRSFHLDCVGLADVPQGTFRCDECLTGVKACFACGETIGDVIQCGELHCNVHVHKQCAVDLDRMYDGVFNCKLHTCTGCKNPASTKHPLLRCRECPLTTYHATCVPASCQDSYGVVTCPRHYAPPPNHASAPCCLQCGQGGSLLCCDTCPAVYHKACIGLSTATDAVQTSDPIANEQTEQQVGVPVQECGPSSASLGGQDEIQARASTTNPESTTTACSAANSGDATVWCCHDCVRGLKPIPCEIVWAKYGKFRFWPCQIVPTHLAPPKLAPKLKPGLMLVRWFGSTEYAFLTHGSIVPWMEGDEASRFANVAGTKKAFKQAVAEAAAAFVEFRESRATVLAQVKGKVTAPKYQRIKVNDYAPVNGKSRVRFNIEPCQDCGCKAKGAAECGESCFNRMLNVECDPRLCGFGSECTNLRIQQRKNPRLVPIETPGRGWGLRLGQDVQAGDFIVEYVGEVIDSEECKSRLTKEEKAASNSFYMLSLAPDLFIDARLKANLARFINHSCDPNCVTQKWEVLGEPRVGIFANQDIPANTELTFDYQLDCLGSAMKTKCMCGSANCSGFIGAKRKTPKPEPKKGKAKRGRGRGKGKRATKAKRQPAHDNECALCQDGGSLILCSKKDCPRAYHLHCIGQQKVPRGTWYCPIHFCDVCGKKATVSIENDSYCAKHVPEAGLGTNAEASLPKAALTSQDSSEVGSQEQTPSSEILSAPVTISAS
eukprot:m.158064 g.158064  ORF g.158064 m.158064 type:complete len:1255 (-) comp14337_c0_seq15:406-4170(-)